MKLKLTCYLIGSLLLSSSLFAQKNNKKLAAEMVDKLGTEVTLSKEQKATLQSKTEDYILRMQEANAITDKKQLIEMHKKAFERYNSSIDSTLTKNQKTQREAKIKDHETKTNIKK